MKYFPKLGRPRLTKVLCGLVGIAMMGFGFLIQAQEPVTHSRSEFMRAKLEYSKGLIEGLTLEDYPLISKNARALKALSVAAEWEVPMIPNVEQYLPYTNEFQGLCDELVANAKERDIDGATLVYVRLTLNCVNCHKYVRDTIR